MKIVVYSFKGGQGKTSISINLANELDCSIITNDIYSPLEDIFEKSDFLKLALDQDVPSKEQLKNADIIFDFGGYLDKRVRPALEMSDFVIIPIAHFGKLTLKTFISTIEEVRKLNNKILIVFNKLEYKEEDIDKVKNFICKKYGYPIFEIRKSAVMEKIVEERGAVKDIVKKYKIHQRYYRIVEEQFEKIVKHLKK